MAGAVQEQPRTYHRRPVADTVRHHIVLVVAVFSITCSLVYFAAPLIPRRYDLAGTLQVPSLGSEFVGELAKLPQAVLVEVKKRAPDVRATWVSEKPPTLELATSGTNYDTCWVQLHRAAEQFSGTLARSYHEALSDHRAALQTSVNQSGEGEQLITKKIEAFRIANRGRLPDDPNSIVSQFDKLSARLDERRERLQLLANQIARLEKLKESASETAAPNVKVPASKANDADKDPEVLALRAQVQLLNDQLSEQLGTMRRTEQHPYVVELRAKQGDLQKKLDAAKERATAGKPPPPEVVANVGTGPGKSSLDVQLETLQAERETLEVDVRTLAAQREQMQKQLDSVAPVRQEFAQLGEQLAAAKKSREAAVAELESFDRSYRATSDGKFALAETPSLAMRSTSKAPSFPRPPLVMAIGLALAAVTTGVCIMLLRLSDRSLHNANDAAAALELPVLGTVSEIYTRSQRHRLRWWRIVGQPGASILLIVMGVGCASLCVERLEDPHFPQSVQQQGLMSTLFAGSGGG